MPSPTRILIVNAALNGQNGNTAALLNRAEKFLQPFAEIRHVCLAEAYHYDRIREELTAAQGIIFGTGTHWDSWSSHLQRLLEDATPDEAGAAWFAKPAGVLVSMHSVGGKGVVSRLQGVLCTLGCLIPPMSGLAYSYVNQTALAAPAASTLDLWSMDDVDVVAWNVLTAAKNEHAYRKWPVDRGSAGKKWICGVNERRLPHAKRATDAKVSVPLYTEHENPVEPADLKWGEQSACFASFASFA